MPAENFNIRRETEKSIKLTIDFFSEIWDIIREIIWIVASSIISILIGWVLRGLPTINKYLNPTAKLLKNFLQNDITIIVPEIPSDYVEESLKKGKADLTAAADIRSGIKKFNDVSITQEDFVTDEPLNNNIILVGGPITNKKTEKFLEYYPYGFDNHALVKEDTGLREEPHHPHEDTGMLIVDSNPEFNGNNYLAILAGCWGYGTSIAGEALSKEKWAKKLWKKVKKEKITDGFFAIVNATIDDEGNTHNFKIKHLEQIERLT